jgi:hypothetical protein
MSDTPAKLSTHIGGVDQLGVFAPLKAETTDHKIFTEKGNDNLIGAKMNIPTNIFIKIQKEICDILPKSSALEIIKNLNNMYYLPIHSVSSQEFNSKPQSYIKHMYLTDDYPMMTKYIPDAHYTHRIDFDIKNTPETKELFKQCILKLLMFDSFNIPKMLKNHNINKYNATKKIVYLSDGNDIVGKTIGCKLSSTDNHDRNKNNIYKALHWGQRKLIISEIYAIVLVINKLKKEQNKKFRVPIIYPGSASGTHLMHLMNLFPEIDLYLWDPAKYNNVLLLIEFQRRGLKLNFHPNSKDIKIASGYTGRVYINMDMPDKEFLEWAENAQKREFEKNYKKEYGFYTKKSYDFLMKFAKSKKIDMSNILMISDIRLMGDKQCVETLYDWSLSRFTKIHDYISKVRTNKEFDRDMNLQKEWCGYGVRFALLKMKLPKLLPGEELTYKYLDGKILMQSWAGIHSTETRLFYDAKETPNEIYYNIFKYERMLEYYNKIMRLLNLNNTPLSELGIKIAQCAGGSKHIKNHNSWRPVPKMQSDSKHIKNHNSWRPVPKMQRDSKHIKNHNSWRSVPKMQSDSNKHRNHINTADNTNPVLGDIYRHIFPEGIGVDATNEVMIAAAYLNMRIGEVHTCELINFIEDITLFLAYKTSSSTMCDNNLHKKHGTSCSIARARKTSESEFIKRLNYVNAYEFTVCDCEFLKKK